MARLRFSRRADADLLSIAGYKWSGAQAAAYLDELETCCRVLAENPSMGRLCNEVRPGLRRHEHGKHVFFYRQERGGVLICRVLHERMLPDRHAIDDTDN